MIYVNQLIFITPPKTGSSSLGFMLSENGLKNAFTSYVYFYDDKLLKHYQTQHHIHPSTCLVLQNTPYRKILLVRNPYEKLISSFFFLSGMHTEEDHEQYTIEHYQARLLQYVQYILKTRQEVGTQNLLSSTYDTIPVQMNIRNLYEYYQASQAEGYVKIENIVEDLQPYNIIIKNEDVVVKNKTAKRPKQFCFQDYFTAESLQIANQ